MQYWFTADWHLFHDHIRDLQPRPHWTLEEMHEALIENYNALVHPGDIVWMLGDFSYGGKKVDDEVKAFFRRMKGQKFLIRGNHDYHNKIVSKLKWAWQGDLRTIRIGEQYIALSHYAQLVWDKQNKRGWNLYGHSHSNLPDNPKSLQIDVGVDAHNYRPINFDEVAEIMSRKEYFPPQDHHIPEGGVDPIGLSDIDLFDEWKLLITEFRSHGSLADEKRERLRLLTTHMRQRNLFTYEPSEIRK